MSDIPRVKELFDAVLARPVAERRAYLDEHCRGNLDLRAQVWRLLEADRDPVDLVTPGARLADALDVLTELGPYRNLAIVGEGGFGVVYSAEQFEPVQRRVAIKVMRMGMNSDELVSRFESERRALAKMEHPNIASIFDAGLTDGGLPYFVMEFVDGRPITEYCDAHSSTIRARLKLFADVCRAVQHAHGKGVIHRDLKPSNVLITEIDGRAVPKVIDFGIAKATNQEVAQRTMFTAVGSVIGTPHYMSPEQADLRHNEIDTRTDVYSLGVMLYELLSGMRPFDDGELGEMGYLELIRWIQDNEAPALARRAADGDCATAAAARSCDERAFLRELDGELGWITRRAMEKDPAHRYATAYALALDLERHLAHEPVVARPTSVAYRASKFLRRHRIAVMVSGVAFVAIVLGIFVAVAQRAVAVANESAARSSIRATKQARGSEQAALAAYRRMRDVPLADQLVQEAETRLWPARPSMVADMDAWIRRADELVRRGRLHRAWLEELGAVEDSAYENRFLRGVLNKLIAKLDRIEGDSGLLASVKARRRNAATLVQRSLVKGRDAWSRARDRMAANTKYGGMPSLVPQLGLLPLGPDPDSTLEEFVLLDTGSIPSRDSSGELVREDRQALVFVLIPKGRFTMGAQSTDPAAPNYDPLAMPMESPVHEVGLDAYFLSKYEMTQAQWLCVTGRNPSLFRPGVSNMREGHTLAHPVENISRLDATATLAKIGCRLPTEAQWEYAARAGTTTPWWTGRTILSLERAANIADSSYRRAGKPEKIRNDELDDGHVGKAAIGSFRGNAFGLHDVTGNVWEWCRDPYEDYSEPPRPGDGQRSLADAEPIYGVYRGGSFGVDASYGRVARRWWAVPMIRNRALGLRPARVIDR